MQEPKQSRIKWSEARNIALLAQIVVKGVAAFVTSKANSKEKTYNQAEAWINEDDGVEHRDHRHAGGGESRCAFHVMHNVIMK